MMRLPTLVLAALLALAAVSPVQAYGCFEPCPDGEVHSDQLDMCVAAEVPST